MPCVEVEILQINLNLAVYKKSFKNLSINPSIPLNK